MRALALIALLTVCCQSSGIVRVIRPLEGPGVSIRPEGSAVVRSVLCDVTAVHVNTDLLRRIERSRAYGGAASLLRREPSLVIFLVAVTNTTRSPIRLTDAWCEVGGENRRIVPTDRLAEFLDADIGETDRLGSSYLLKIQGDSARPIDYLAEAVECRYPFILAGDTTARLLIFEWMPSYEPIFTLTLTFVSFHNEEKSVRIQFIQREYRSSGNEFRRRDARNG